MGLFTELSETKKKSKKRKTKRKTKNLPNVAVCRGNLNPKRDRCAVKNPMDCSTKQKCQFGHSLTNSSTYQSSVGCEQAKCEFDRTAEILKTCYGVKIKTPFKCRL